MRVLKLSEEFETKEKEKEKEKVNRLQNSETTTINYTFCHILLMTNEFEKKKRERTTKPGCFW